VPHAEPNEIPSLDTTVSFREAYLAADLPRLRDLLTPRAFLVAPGAGALAGRYEGPQGVVAFARRLGELTNGTFRPKSDEAWDVAVSRYHAFLYQSFAWQSDGQECLSHEVWLLAFRNGKVARIFQYLEDPAPYAELTSAAHHP
jgi:ketosteroid isomerase-like protein